MKSSILKTHENCEESVSSTRRTRESNETIKNARKKLETPVSPLCLARFARSTRIVGVVHPIKSKQNLRVFWKLANLQGLRMGESLPIHHDDHFAGKGDNSPQHYNLVHKFIPMPQAMKIPAAK